MDKKKIPYIVIAMLAFGLFFYMLFPFLDVALFGIFIYYIARPIYRTLVRITKSETLSAMIALLFLILPMILLFTYLVSIAANEISDFLSSEINMGINLTDMFAQLGEFSVALGYEDLITLIKENTNVGKTLIDAASSSITILFKMFLALIVAYYLLTDGHKLRLWFTGTLFNNSEIAKKFFKNIDTNFHHLFIGNILAAVITAIFGCIIFLLVDNFLLPPELSIGKYAIVLGILCGAASLIPGIGMKLVWVPLLIYFIIQAYLLNILFEVWWIIIIAIVIIVFFVDWVPDLLVRPYIAGKDTHTGLILFSYVLGPWVFGFKGLLLGPMIVVVVINLCRILPRIREDD